MAASANGKSDGQDDGARSKADDFALVLEAARVLHNSGAETSRTIAAVHRVCNALEIEATVFVEWNQILLKGPSSPGLVAVGSLPDVVSMNRVMATLAALDSLGRGEATVLKTRRDVAAARSMPPAGLPAFVPACIFGAVALAIIAGAHTFDVLALIGVAAGSGAFARRGLAAISAGPLPQLLAAGFLAGTAGIVGMWLHLGTDLRLVALGPCLVLNPGPPILNGALDFAGGRIPLGLARWTFAALSFAAIGVGLFIGLHLGGTSLPPANPNTTLPFWLELMCAGVASAAYGVFFSMPLRLIVWPAFFGALLHAVHWVALNFAHLNPVLAAAIGTCVVGTVTVPFCSYLRLPFAAVGFAAAVSLVPGIVLMRMTGGFVEIQLEGARASAALMGATLSDFAAAVGLVLAVTLGLIIPRHIFAHIANEADQSFRR
jgi:uncharacterized membrane protein YjjB (DUF3815 family)